MHSVARVLAVAGLAAVGLTCADRNIAGLRGKLALIPITPVWLQGPDGGPDIEIERVRGVLRTSGGTDSAVAEGLVAGDSAVLEFLRVTVTGDSTSYNLAIQAFDSNDVVVFSANDTIAVRPGENPPATPELQYTAPDASAATVEIQIGGASASSTDIHWAGAQPGNTSCLSRAPDAEKATTRQLGVIGRTATDAVVTPIRVGWTSLDESVATVDDNGLVRARCSNRSTKVVARSFLDHADTITVNVTAPPFTLLMTPEQTSVVRGGTLQMQALIVDENSNETSTTNVQWNTSDPSKATVSGTGLVRALRNGRVQITATADNRTTVGIIDIVRPQAASVTVVPVSDTVTFGMVRQFVARALDAAGNVIADAVNFQWTSSKPTVATVATATGVAAANTQSVVDSTELTATIDGKSGSAKLHVASALEPGTIKGVIRDAATDLPIEGATVSVGGGGVSATSGPGGRFSLTPVHQGDDITVTADTYVPLTFTDAPAFPGQTFIIDDVPLAPAGGGNGSIQGKVVNAFNGAGVSGVTVRIYPGLNSGPTPINPNPTAAGTTTTNASGTFTFTNRAPGSYTFVATLNGYATGIGLGTVVGGITRGSDNIFLPPTAPSASGIYVVLTWNQAGGTNVPDDLDVIVRGPTSASDPTPFEVHSGTPAHVSGVDTIATIDLADAAGPGPEVGSLRAAAAPGIYRFFVKNVSHFGIAGSASLADSAGARLDVYQGNRIIATFVPPAGEEGDLWEVFSFDGAKIRPVGQMTGTEEPDALQAGLRKMPVKAGARPPTPKRR